MRAAHTTGPLCVGLALALAASGCGGASSPSATTPAAATTQASSAGPKAIARTPHLSILSPRAGEHAGSTLTVRVAVSGVPSGGARRFRYVLDRRLTRSGTSRLTFRELVPGRHRLEVLLDGSAAHASTTFTVRAPAPAVQPPGEVSRTSAAPTTAAPVPSTTPAPAETTPTPPAKTTPAPPSGGIPQGPGAGDGDSDNNGGPSDGDGNF